MIITIDTTQPLSDQDITLLKVLLPADADWPQVEPAPEPEKPKPAKKAAAKKATPKAEPKPDLREQAVSAARDLLDAGEREKVMAALKDLEVSRVSDLPDESLQAFLDAISE